MQITNEYTNKTDSIKDEKQSSTPSKTMHDKVGHVLDELFFLLEENSYYVMEQHLGCLVKSCVKERFIKLEKLNKGVIKNKSSLTNLNILRFIKEGNKLPVLFLCGIKGLEFSVE